MIKPCYFNIIYDVYNPSNLLISWSKTPLTELNHHPSEVL